MIFLSVISRTWSLRHHFIVFAREGLDLIEQVVLNFQLNLKGSYTSGDNFGEIARRPTFFNVLVEFIVIPKLRQFGQASPSEFVVFPLLLKDLWQFKR